MDIPYMQSMGYLARATVNTVLKGSHIMQKLDTETEAACKIQ